MSDPQNRRQFGKSLILGAAAYASGKVSSANAESNEAISVDGVTRPSKTMIGPGVDVQDSRTWHVRTSGTLSKDGLMFREDQRNIPVTETCDVLVCGGGPAGVAAAIASARSGAKTCLLELNGCVGGVWTAGLLSWIIDSRNKPGIMKEIQEELFKRGASEEAYSNGNVPYDAEKMKLLLEDLLLEAGVQIRLHTRVVGAVVNDKNRLETVLTESKSGREAWTAKSFIDTTGDGDLSAQAGCRFDLGHPTSGGTQPFSLMAILTGLETKKIAKFIRNVSPDEGRPSKYNLFNEFKSAGIEPSYGLPTLFRIHEDLYALMANHQYGVLPIDARHVTDATLSARRELHKMIDMLKKSGGPWGNVRLITTGEQIGTREGRRIRGRYYLRGEDLKNGQQFEDGICPVTFGIDVHAVNPKIQKGIEKAPFRSKPYDIPLRSLIAKDVDGLMMAGRCISGDFIAHSSYRVTGNSVTMGEAAGVASAVAVRNNVMPHEVPFQAVSADLEKIRKEAEVRSK